MKDILPEALYNILQEIHTPDEMLIIKHAFETEKRKPTFRINTLKAHVDNTLDSLTKIWLKIEPVPYLDNAFFLEEWTEKDLWDSWAFKAWYIYMQGISSMIPPLLFSDPSESSILDLAAAPWSKTSQLAMMMNNSWSIVAVDNNQIRIDKLNFTLKRQWVSNTQVLKTDARNFSTAFAKENETKILPQFDKMLFDAPCSAEWRMNTHVEKSFGFWNETIPKKNYKLQRDIMRNNIELLKIWWELVYSTCTLSPLENEWMVHFILSNFPDIEIVDISEMPIFSDLVTKPWIAQFWKNAYRKDVSHSIRILPTAEYEGFFIAKFRKKVA